MSVPSHLESTVELLRNAYPSGLPDEEKLALLAILKEHLSERNLGLAMMFAFGVEPSGAMNDAASTLQNVVHTSATDCVMKRLVPAGFERWKSENE